VREIRTLRAMWRALETGLRQLLNGHEEGNLSQAKEEPTGHRASARPYQQLKPVRCLTRSSPHPDRIGDGFSTVLLSVP